MSVTSLTAVDVRNIPGSTRVTTDLYHPSLERSVEPGCSSRIATATETSQQGNPLTYVALTLRRNTAKWGLSLSLFDESFLVLGSINGAVGTTTMWSHVTKCAPCASLIYDPAITSQDRFRATFAVMHPPSPHVVPLLLPGDLILSLDGRAISSFGSLSAISFYLRQVTDITIVVARHDLAQRLACTVLNNHGSNDIDQSHLAAQMACQVMKKAFRDSSANPVFGLYPFQSLHGLYPTTPQPQWPVNDLHKNMAAHHALATPESIIPDRTTFMERDFQGWLDFKKRQWRVAQSKRQFIKSRAPCSPTWQQPLAKRQLIFKTPTPPSMDAAPVWRNPLFQGKDGKHLVFSDSSTQEFDPEEGTRAEQFLIKIDQEQFPSWLALRKETWRKKWHPYKFDDDDWSCDGEQENVVAHDFWTQQGYSSFDNWLAESTTKWKRSYSWNERKRRRIEKECEEVVHFPSCCSSNEEDAEAQLQRWLHIRKNQWRVLRRKRQRQREEEASVGDEAPVSENQTSKDGNEKAGNDSFGLRNIESLSSAGSTRRCVALNPSELLCIDALLEEEEQRRKAAEERPPLDISFVFDAQLGAPDDTIAHCLRFLDPSEHWKFLCISATTSRAIKKRDHLWRQLCPEHWKLPRRPRKPLHELYITKIRTDEEADRKRSDGILLKASDVLLKGDNLQQIRRLVEAGEKRFGFDVNYVSGVVCERNGLLNLAVINQRLKTVKWLVESKGADIESCDRGQFTPLLNASWAGDRTLVRYFLSRGSNRKKVGTGHYTQPLAPPEFLGLNAEGWARERGHDEIGDLISTGL